MSIMELSGVLSEEEIEVLSKSSICLNCNHREVLHNRDYEEGIECRVCECTECILEGDCSYWSVESLENRKRFDTICKPFESTILKLLESAALKTFAEERELNEVTGKIMRIKRYDRLKLPE